MVYLPFRDIKVYDISIDNFTCPFNEHFEEFQEFLCCGTFDQVLCENGFLPATTPFIHSGISDGAFYLGWHGYDDSAIDIVQDFTAFVQMGVIIPFAKRQQRKLLSSVPLGYDGHFAASTRFAVEAGLADLFAVGVNGGVDIVWSDESCETIKTDLCQTGLIFFGKETIKLRPGLVWGAGAYFHFDEPMKGLHIIGGYSYGKRDRTRVDEVRCDDLPLASARPKSCSCGRDDSEPQPNPGCTICCPVVPLTKRETIKEDQRLRGWQHHTLHVKVTLDGHDYFDYAPFIAFEYDFPFDGTRAFATDMIGGTAGLTLSWGF